MCGIRSQPGGLLESEEGYGGGSHHSSTSLGKRDPQYDRVSRGFLGLQSRILVLGPSGGTASMPSVLETIKLHTAESSRLFYFVLFFWPRSIPCRFSHGRDWESGQGLPHCSGRERTLPLGKDWASLVRTQWGKEQSSFLLPWVLSRASQGTLAVEKSLYQLDLTLVARHFSDLLLPLDKLPHPSTSQGLNPF